MAVRLTDPERAVLAKIVELAKTDDSGAWNWFYPEIAKAGIDAGASEYELDGICRGLRRRKLLEGQGTGKWASYWPTEKGKEAVRG